MIRISIPQASPCSRNTFNNTTHIYPLVSVKMSKRKLHNSDSSDEEYSNTSARLLRSPLNRTLTVAEQRPRKRGRPSKNTDHAKPQSESSVEDLASPDEEDSASDPIKGFQTRKKAKRPIPESSDEGDFQPTARESSDSSGSEDEEVLIAANKPSKLGSRSITCKLATKLLRRLSPKVNNVDASKACAFFLLCPVVSLVCNLMLDSIQPDLERSHLALVSDLSCLQFLSAPRLSLPYHSLAFFERAVIFLAFFSLSSRLEIFPLQSRFFFGFRHLIQRGQKFRILLLSESVLVSCIVLRDLCISLLELRG